MRIVWSPLALERVEEIARVIGADRPAASVQWVRSVFARVAQLREHPESGRMAPELTRPEIRQLPLPPYRIIYRVEAGRILVLTVRHGRENVVPADIENAENR
jgi:toxin ParE1/3/4